MFLHLYCILYTLLLSGWESIRKDRFSLTPQALYDELAKNAQFILSAWSGDATRRQARMKAPLEHEEGEDAAEGDEDDAHDDEVEEEAPMRPKDEFLDIDKEFRCGIRYQRFANWEDTAKIAFEVHLDEMKTLLELHYDDVSSSRALASSRRKQRPGGVFASIACAHRHKLNQKLTLPDRV